MPDIVHVTYAHTGQSSQTNHYGMREMQEKAYQARDAQYLLLKAPPASGKSRALMFIALDKLANQGIKKVIGFFVNFGESLSFTGYNHSFSE